MIVTLTLTLTLPPPAPEPSTVVGGTLKVVVVTSARRGFAAGNLQSICSHRINNDDDQAVNIETRGLDRVENGPMANERCD